MFLFFFPTQVLEDQQNIRLIRELLQTLYTSLCTLVQRVGKCVLVGNINMWVYRMETILHWQQQLSNIQITRVSRSPQLARSRKSSSQFLCWGAGQPCQDFISSPVMDETGPFHSDALYWVLKGRLGCFLIKGEWEGELGKTGSKYGKDDSQWKQGGGTRNSALG